MHEIFKSHQAKNDLKEIYFYTLNKWGSDKAVDYLMQIDAGLQELINNPMLGKSRDYISDGYRSVQINRHVIFYRVQKTEIFIVRVLHERMLPSKHL